MTAHSSPAPAVTQPGADDDETTAVTGSPGTSGAQRFHPLKRWGSPGLVAAVAVLSLVALATVVPQALARYSPTAMDFDSPLQAPSWQHWLGTDESGRDLYSRIVHGARLSVTIGVGAATLALILALVLGTVAALGPRTLGGAVDRLIEVLFAFPHLLLALLLVAVLSPSAATQLLAVGIGGAPGYARMVRGQVLSARSSGYVEAAVALGHSRGRIIVRHILPNALRPLVAIFTLSVGQSIVWASGMSFLGMGVAPPASEWGALLDAGREFIIRAPWLIIFPGAVIVVLALSVTVVGRHMQAALEKGNA